MEEDEDEGPPPGTDIVLHEDKKYYPTAEEVYGPDVETLVMEEDAQPLEQPILARESHRKFDLVEAETPATTVSSEFLSGLLGTPDLVRHIAVAGHLHHGKTSLMDLLVLQTHALAYKFGDDGKLLR